MPSNSKGSGYLPLIPRAAVISLLLILFAALNVAADDDVGLCPSFYALNAPIDLTTCDFLECYDEGFDDSYLCEGCSLVSSKGIHDVTDGSLDSDCACTCCFYQYVVNYCFRNHCANGDEYSRARGYISNVCAAAPVRTTIKPYIDESKIERLQLFISNENSVYRSLEDDEKAALFDYVGGSLDLAGLRSRYPSVIKKRSLTSDCIDGQEAEDGFFEHEIYQADDNLADDEQFDGVSLHEAFRADSYDDGIGLSEYDYDYESSDGTFDSQRVEALYQDDDNEEWDENEGSEFEIANDITDNDVDVENYDADSGSGDTVLRTHEEDNDLDEDIDVADEGFVIQSFRSTASDRAREDYDDIGDWNTEKFNPDLYDDIEDLDDIEGLDPIDPLELMDESQSQTPERLMVKQKISSAETLKRRDIDIETFEKTFQGGPEVAFGDINELSFGVLADVLESLEGNGYLFLTGLKAYLPEKEYSVFHNAYQVSFDDPDTLTMIEKLDKQYDVFGHECQRQSDGSFVRNFLEQPVSSSNFGSMKNAFGFMGCAIGQVRALRRYLRRLGQTQDIVELDSCQMDCITITLMSHCLERYSPDDSAALSGTVDQLLSQACAPGESKVLNTDVEALSAAIVGDALTEEDIVAADVAFLRHIEPVAAYLNIQEELAEFEADYVWKTTIGDSTPFGGVKASIVLDQCELNKGDLTDYMQFGLASCDIVDLYKCKNRYKKNKCLPDLTNTTNPCNNACCLETRMAYCASSHCASKKAVTQFKVAANLICSKYADPSYMNGILPFPDADSTATSDCISTSDEDSVTSDPTCTSSDSSPTETRSADDNNDCNEEELSGAGMSSVTRREVESSSGAADESLSVTGGDNYDNVKARVGESICKIDNFYPGYDTSSCDKREVKDCIKEGIQMLKDDPKHFCPYCVNNNAYDECRCACCFGRYFSRVCYDPSCKNLSEKLRYKRYVKDVCKTKPVTKYLFARDAARDFDVGTAEDKPRFKYRGAPSKQQESVAVDGEIDIFAGFDDIHPDVDPKVLDQPVNPSSDLLNTLKGSSLRRPMKGGRIYKRESAVLQSSAEKQTVTVSEAEKDNGALTSVTERAHRRLGEVAKKFTKGRSSTAGSKKKPEKFSVLDRKKRPTGSRVSAADSDEYNGATRRKKHRRVVSGSLLSKKKKAGRRTSLSGEKFGAGRKKLPKLRVLDLKKTSDSIRLQEPSMPKPLLNPRDNRFQYEKPITKPSPVLYKRADDFRVYAKGAEIPEVLIMGTHTECSTESFSHVSSTLSTSSALANNTTISATNTNSTDSAATSFSTSKQYKTLTKTITRTYNGNLTSSSTSVVTSTLTSLSSTASSTTSAAGSYTASYAPSTTTVISTTTTTASETSVTTVMPTTSYTPSTTTVHSTTTTTASETLVTIVTSTTSYAPSTTTVLSTTTTTSLQTSLSTVTPVASCTVNSTIMSTQTRYRPTTTTETYFMDTSTLTTTEYDETLTETVGKKTVSQYKDTLTETTTEETTVLQPTTKIKTVANLTLTEIEESDQTVNFTVTEKTTTTEIEFETAWRETSVYTLTTYFGTLTTTGYKYTKTKFQKTGEVTVTTTEVETDDVVITRWIPVTTVTDYDDTTTKLKYKWYPLTTTVYDVEYDTETATSTTTAFSTTTATDTTTSITTTTTTAAATAAAAARPVPSVSLSNIASLLTSLLGRREISDEDVQAYELSKREQPDDEGVEYIVVEEIVEVFEPVAQSYKAAASSNNSTRASVPLPAAAVEYSERSRTLFNSSSAMGASNSPFESGSSRARLNSTVVYGFSIMVLVCSLIFLFSPEGEAGGLRELHTEGNDMVDNDGYAANTIDLPPAVEAT